MIVSKSKRKRIIVLSVVSDFCFAFYGQLEDNNIFFWIEIDSSSTPDPPINFSTLLFYVEDSHFPRKLEEKRKKENEEKEEEGGLGSWKLNAPAPIHRTRPNYSSM